MSFMKLFISGTALVLLLFLGVGFALSGEWSTERTRTVEAPPARVYQEVGDLRRWEGWSSVAQVEGTLAGDPTRPGATLSWDDRNWGEGALEITGLEEDREVRYQVAVEGGSIRTRGVIRLAPSGAGTEITWEESGNMGWNPLLAYFALGMERMQGQELEKGLDRLEALVEGTGAGVSDEEGEAS